MARIRSIKPEFWKSESIAGLSMQSRLTFIGLWSYVDDNGVGRDVAKLIAAELYPLEEDPIATLAHVQRTLDELSRGLQHAFLTRYVVDGKPYLRINNWEVHQKIDRPNLPRYPTPDQADQNSSPPLTCDDATEAPVSDELSRGLREDPSSGAVEQGSSGTEENLKPSPSTALRTRPLVAVFDQFWQTYPHRVGKDAARKAWVKAVRSATPQVIIAGAARYRDDRTRDPAYTKHPSTWLNAGCWADEGPARPTSRPTTGVTQGLALVQHFADQEARG